LDDTPLRLFLRRIRHINPAGSPIQLFSLGDEHAVAEGLEALGHVLLLLSSSAHNANLLVV
jgi:hypothetical protein